MFKLPARPSPRAEIHELADFAELMACAYGVVSAREITAFLGREGESEPNIGCEDIDDQNADDVDEVMDEIERRGRACRGGYPFWLNKVGSVVRYTGSEDSTQAILYRYLLLATRLNMKKSRTYAEVDGTLLFEDVSAWVLRLYLGGDRAKSMVFGTAAGSGDFGGRVHALCSDLGEARGFRSIDDAQVNANDDKLDVVGWIPFADKTAAQIVVFGQCKTGTSWTEGLCQLQPDAFIKTWVDGHFLLDPMRAFFVTEAVNRARWGSYAAKGGLLFDRCRLVDCCSSIDANLIERMRAWGSAAMEAARKDL